MHVCTYAIMNYVGPSEHFYVAEGRKVHFIDYHILECDSSGRKYTNEDHDIMLTIPEGAVPEGKKVHFEVGVAMYGPFIFPGNTQPISPVLWLCIHEEDVKLKKPFEIILPHYLSGLTEERIQYHQVNFAKASHSIGSQMNYKFQNCEAKPLFTCSGHKSFGVLASEHCCFYCLKANVSHKLAMDAGYCIVRIESCITPQRNDIYFCASYFLRTCYCVSIACSTSTSML